MYPFLVPHHHEQVEKIVLACPFVPHSKLWRMGALELNMQLVTLCGSTRIEQDVA